MSAENFEKNDFPQDDILKPDCFLELTRFNRYYDEKPLPKIKSGRYVTYLIVDKIYIGTLTEIFMGTVGCFGYLEKEASEKYPHPIQHGGERLEFPTGHFNFRQIILV